MSNSKTLVWEFVEPVIVIVHSAQAPTDADYDDAIEGYRKHKGKFDGILVYTHGGGPNAVQRKKTADFWKDQQVPKTAICTSSSMVRGIITALNWIFPQALKTFKPQELSSALDYLQVPTPRHGVVTAVVERLRDQLGAQAPVTKTA